MDVIQSNAMQCEAAHGYLSENTSTTTRLAGSSYIPRGPGGKVPLCYGVLSLNAPTTYLQLHTYCSCILVADNYNFYYAISPHATQLHCTAHKVLKERYNEIFLYHLFLLYFLRHRKTELELLLITYC